MKRVLYLKQKQDHIFVSLLRFFDTNSLNDHWLARKLNEWDKQPQQEGNNKKTDATNIVRMQLL